MSNNTKTPISFLEWPRKGNEVVCLATQEFKNGILVHLRIYSRGVNGNLYATVRGVTIPHDQIRRLRKALRKVDKALQLYKSREGSEKQKPPHS